MQHQQDLDQPSKASSQPRDASAPGWGYAFGHILAIPVILFVGFIALIMSIFFVHQAIYTPLVLISGSLLLLLVLIRAGWYARRRLLLALMGLVIAIAIAVVATVEGYHAWYDWRYPRVTVQEPDLQAYEPFVSQRLARLDGPASFTMAEPLLRLDGATAFYPVYAAFVQATYPPPDHRRQVTYRVHSRDSPVRCTRTRQCYDRLIRGECDLIFVLQPSAQQQHMADHMGVRLVKVPIAREAFVFYVHQRNPVRGLTVEQIRGIYSGAISDWSAVGGESAPILAFQRPANSGSQTMLEALMGDVPLQAAPSERTVGMMGGIVDRVSDYRNYANALGYSFLYFASSMIEGAQVRFLPIDGVAPRTQTIADGSYPLTTDVYAVHRSGENNPQLDAFIQWIRSPEGQILIERTGYVPLP
ncbi:MAG: hypothetical protein EA402_04770 [Planctomycetota bacterium]|nr:MAG: hypothetical protein EA402_04770 [Planctomycetota bacterium]